jgi:hypothetical protein
MRILKTADAWYVETPAGAARIDTAAQTTGQLLQDRKAIDAAAASTTRVPANTLDLESPVTTRAASSRDR